MQKDSILENTILCALAGSRAYGTHTETSDVDYKGIFIAEPNYYFGSARIEQSQGFEGHTFRGNLNGETHRLYLTRDTEFFELRKFFKLAQENNPSILDALYSPEIYYQGEVGKILVSQRDMFLSKAAKFRYAGYAHSQIQKIERHRKWLLNPPKKEPDPKDFGMTSELMVSKSELYAFCEYLFYLTKTRIEYCEGAELLTAEFIHLLRENADFKQIYKDNIIPSALVEYTAELASTSKEFVTLMQQAKAYQNAKDHWDSYQQWKTNRNKDRASLEAKVGYDTKHAMHCIRLMRMGCEILQGKGVIVDRREAGDADELRAIRLGDYSFEHIQEMVKNYNEELETSYKESQLPHRPPSAEIENLCVELTKKQLLC